MTVHLLVTVLVLAQVDDASSFYRRLRETDPRDPEGLLELGRWCEEQGRPGWAAKVYTKVLDLERSGRGAHAYEASYRLARLDIARGRHAEAYMRLRGVANEHAAARALLEKAETSETREQVKLVERGDRDLEAGDCGAAVKSYERAHRLLPEEPTDRAYLPARVVLARLAHARRRLDEEHYRSRVLPVREHVVQCSRCEDGFYGCDNCNETGKTVRRFYNPLARRWVTETKPCGGCNGHGYRGCPECLGMGWRSRFSPDERAALQKIVGQIRYPTIFTKPISKAVAEVEEVLLEVEQGSTLNYFRSLQPSYSRSQLLREAIGQVPPLRLEGFGAEVEWRSIARTHDYPKGINFLLNYACEFARYIRRFDMLRNSERPDTTALLGDATPGEVLSPELLAAFPDEARGNTVRGTFQGYREDPEDLKGYLTLAGSHTVEFFVWLPSAKSHLERLQTGPWRRKLKGLGDLYPFSIGGEASEAPRDHTVTLVGRFLRDRLENPPNRFEVWRFEVGLSQKQETILRALEEPISEISFPDMAARDVGRILSAWFDLGMVFRGVPDGTRITCVARDCPLGLLVDAIVRRGLGAQWRYEDGNAVVSLAPPPGAARDTAAVLERLKETSSPRIDVTRPSGATHTTELPRDPAGLRVVAREAALAMDYETSSRAFEELLDLDSRRDAIERLRDKYRLFHRLTGGVAENRLVDAPQVTRIRREVAPGVVREQWVRVIEDRGDTLKIQEAYGAILTLKNDAFEIDTSVPGEEWRAERKAELQKLAAGVDGLGPRERAHTLFALALLAKTHRIVASGTGYLEAAIAEEEFPAVLETFCSEELPSLREVWASATGRLPAESPRAPAPAPRAMRASSSEPPPPAVEPIAKHLSVDESLRKVLEYKRRGHRCLGRSLEAENPGIWHRRAFEFFQAALEAVRTIPGGSAPDADIDRLRTDLSRLVNDSLKLLGFFE